MDEVVDIEEAILEETQEITGLVPATQEAMDLPDCEIHDFVFLRTGKVKEKIKIPNKEPGQPDTQFRRMDTFYCQHCLRYTTMERKEMSTKVPDWYRDDR